MQRRKFMSAGFGMLAFASGAGWSSVPASSRGDATLPGQRLYRAADLAFGTTVSIQVVHHNEREAREAIDAAFSQARQIDKLLSLYREGSQVHTLNTAGRLENPDPHLLAVLEESMRLSALTKGAFDITVQPLWQAAAGERDPAAALDLVGWRHLDIARDVVRLRQPGMAITLNGIAQGYATDLALAALRTRGIRNALVDIGELASVGRGVDGTDWRVGIDAQGASSTAKGARMDGRCIATSGEVTSMGIGNDMRRHIYDPATGQPAAALSSVSVAAPTAMLADGLSTALMVLGKARGMQLVRQLPGVDALFIDKRGKASWSAGFPFA